MMKHLFACGVLLLFIAIPGHSQTFRGSINGTVTDQTGAALAGATVKATDTGTEITLTTVTTAEGQYSFQDLPAGTYQVAVTAAGFTPVTVEKIPVTAGAIYTLPVTLRVGQQATAVEVSAAAITVDTTSVTQSDTIPDAALQDLPMNGRDFSQLIAIAPGYAGYSVGGYGSLYGTRANQMNWQI
ncbi:MAG: carboxypeptidase-like regulatory domain-containing protein, partial [Bryobacteraceae bacterium]